MPPLIIPGFMGGPIGCVLCIGSYAAQDILLKSILEPEGLQVKSVWYIVELYNLCKRECEDGRGGFAPYPSVWEIRLVLWIVLEGEEGSPPREGGIATYRAGRASGEF